MLVKFEKNHIAQIEMREHEKRLMEAAPALADNLERCNEAITGVINGQIVACGGIAVNCFSVGDIWLIPSRLFSDYAMKAARLIKQWLNEMRAKYKLVRMQTVSLDDDLHNNWMRFLGFEKEGVMKKYALNKDYAMWGLVWEQK